MQTKQTKKSGTVCGVGFGSTWFILHTDDAIKKNK